jgi:hypothetical protein
MYLWEVIVPWTSASLDLNWVDNASNTLFFMKPWFLEIGLRSFLCKAKIKVWLPLCTSYRKSRLFSSLILDVEHTNQLFFPLNICKKWYIARNRTFVIHIGKVSTNRTRIDKMPFVEKSSFVSCFEIGTSFRATSCPRVVQCLGATFGGQQLAWFLRQGHSLSGGKVTWNSGLANTHFTGYSIIGELLLSRNSTICFYKSSVDFFIVYTEIWVVGWWFWAWKNTFTKVTICRFSVHQIFIRV